jgi:hypothetical protein
MMIHIHVLGFTLPNTDNLSQILAVPGHNTLLKKHTRLCKDNFINFLPYMN